MNISRKTRVARYGVVASFVLLLLLLLASRSWSALPLLIFAWGIWHQDWRIHIWLCFVLLFYFLIVINQLAQAPGAWTSWIECGLIVILFTSAMLYCRWVKAVPANTSTQGAL